MRLHAARDAILLPLTRRGDFVRATKLGHSVGTPAFVLQTLPLANPVPGTFAVGFTASRKFSKRAVDRNRAKRRLRALVQESLPLYAGPERGYVLIARRAILDRPFADLRRDLSRAIARLESPQPAPATPPATPQTAVACPPAS